MTMLSIRPTPHGKNELGFMRLTGTIQAHYWKSHQRAGIAISHCQIIANKDFLDELGFTEMCAYCKMMEEIRDGMDAPDEHE